MEAALATWAPIEESFRRRRNAAWGAIAWPVAGPNSPARTPPPSVVRIESQWHRAFLAHFGFSAP